MALIVEAVRYNAPVFRAKQVRNVNKDSRVLQWLAAAAIVVGGIFAPATASDIPKVEALIALHDLSTSVSIGHYYLKQEGVLAVRAQLDRIGRDERLGANWNPANPLWRQAEQTLLAQVMAQVDADFASLQWLKPLWVELGRNEFSDEEVDALLTHLRSAVGRKQVQIVDHTVSTHVMMALSFSGKFKDVSGIDAERIRMQQLWNDEDREMRFSIQDAANADGQAFALSPLGKKYFVTAVLKLTGIVSHRIDQVAAQVPDRVAANVDSVWPLVEEFKNGRS
jgi:hypothetical protein